MRAFLVRRWRLIDEGAGLTIVGSCYSRDTRRLRDFAARNRLPHRWIDLERDREAEQLLRELHVAPEETPVVIWHHHVLRNPDNADLARRIGLRHRCRSKASATSSSWEPGRRASRPPCTAPQRASTP